MEFDFICEYCAHNFISEVIGLLSDLNKNETKQRTHVF